MTNYTKAVTNVCVYLYVSLIMIVDNIFNSKNTPLLAMQKDKQ